jgi:hypothetical protein
MIELEREITTHGRVLRQRKREGRIAIYELHHPVAGLIGYEVIVIEIRKAGEVFGREYPDREAYPSNEDWGTLGWSYQTRDLAGALKRYATLLAERPANGLREAQKGVFGGDPLQSSSPKLLDPFLAASGG